MANRKSSTNRFGLTRDIGDPVRRKVRQQSGFGCVVCGNAVVHYEHFDPEFKDAREHAADGMTLLCGRHHDEKTRGFLPREELQRYIDDPCALRAGYSHGALEQQSGPPTIKVGGVVSVDSASTIQVLDRTVLGLHYPTDPHEPALLTAYLTDPSGKDVLAIDQNEWTIRSDVWDAEVTGTTITIKRKLREIILRLTLNPDDSALELDRLEMTYCGVSLRCGPSKNLAIRYGQDRWSTIEEETTLVGCERAIDVQDGGWTVGVGCESTRVQMTF